MKLPPERILYTDPNGGQILGYTADDLVEVASRTRRKLDAKRPRFRATARQIEVLSAITLTGSPTNAAEYLQCTLTAVEGVLASLKRRYKGRTTLQLCVMNATGEIHETRSPSGLSTGAAGPRPGEPSAPGDFGPSAPR